MPLSSSSLPSPRHHDQAVSRQSTRSLPAESVGRGRAGRGDVGDAPSVHLWDANTGASLVLIEGFHRGGVALLQFSDDGTLLASVGLDEHHTVALHTVRDGQLVAHAKAGSRKPLGVAIHPGNARLATSNPTHDPPWTKRAPPSTHPLLTRQALLSAPSSYGRRCSR